MKPLRELVRAKGGRRVSVCLPARNEAATVGVIVDVILATLVGASATSEALVDEVLVVDDGSTDATVEVARDKGATVVRAEEVLPHCGPGTGKGEALWKALHVATGDLIVFCDADVVGFGPHFVTRLLEPLLTDAEPGFVKGYYDRPLNGVPGAGGRVTELVARPLIDLFFPHLAAIRQPLAGEYAARRDVLEQLPFVEGYGVDLALLIDVADRFGPRAIVQADLGSRTHRNRPLDELTAQAREVMRTGLARAGVGDPVRWGFDKLEEREPIIEVAAYRAVRRAAERPANHSPTAARTQPVTSAPERSGP